MAQRRKHSTGKGKGSAYERKVCQRLSLWVSKLTRTDCFWRSAMSGGRSTVARKNKGKHHEAHAGDITATHKLGNLLCRLYVIECKFYKSLYLESTFYGWNGKVEGWWNKTKEVSDELGKEPLLILKENRRPDLFLTTDRGRDILACGVRDGMRLLPVFHLPRLGAWAFLLSDVLAKVKFETVRQLHGKLRSIKQDLE